MGIFQTLYDYYAFLWKFWSGYFSNLDGLIWDNFFALMIAVVLFALVSEPEPEL